MSKLTVSTIVAVAPNKSETKTEKFWLAWTLKQNKDDPTFWLVQWFQRLQTTNISQLALSQGIIQTSNNSHTFR